MFRHESKESISSSLFKMVLLLTLIIVITVIGLRFFFNQQLHWEFNIVLILAGIFMGAVWVRMVGSLITSYRMDKIATIVRRLECCPDSECLCWNAYAYSMLTATLSRDSAFMKDHYRFKKLFPPK